MDQQISKDPEITRRGCQVIAYTSTTTFTYPSLSACARAYGVARARIVELIVTGASHIDGITTFDVPMDSEVNLDAYKIVDRSDR